MTDTSVMNYALTSASVAPASATSTSTNSMAAAAAFYQQQAAASAALASLDPAVSHHHQPLASAAAASAAALANVDSPARYPWMSITGKASSLFSHSLAHSCIPSCMYVQEGAYFFRGHLEDATLGSSYCTALQCQNLLPGSGRVWRLRRQPLWWLAVFEDHRKEASCFLTNGSQVCVRV